MNSSNDKHVEGDVEGDEGEEFDNGEDGDEDEGEERVLEEAEKGPNRELTVHRVKECIADVLLRKGEKRNMFNRREKTIKCSQNGDDQIDLEAADTANVVVAV